MAALLQLFMTVAIIVTASLHGGCPTSAAEHFDLLQDQRLVGILRDDYASLIIVALYSAQRSARRASPGSL